MAKAKIGDIVEIRTKLGLFYAQCSHKHREFGHLLRVFGRGYNVRPDSFEEAINLPPQFLCFFPLDEAVKLGVVSIVGNAPVPEEGKPFPIFRDGVADPNTKKVKTWWLWDGETEWRVGDLTPDQRKFPIREVINDTLLIEHIETGWTHEKTMF